MKLPPAGEFVLVPIGRVHSPITNRKDAPKQGWEGAPDARIEIHQEFLPGLRLLEPGQEIIILTWLHQSRRETLEVHPRRNPANPLTGVFQTRSPDRPNPIGLHQVLLLDVNAAGWLSVRGLEAIDGTPVVDIKPVIAPDCPAAGP